MRHYLAGVFREHPFGLVAAITLVVLTLPTYRLICTTTATVAALPGQVQALQTAIELVPGQIVGRLTEQDGLIDRHATRIETDLNARLSDALGQVSRVVDGDPESASTENRMPLREVMLSRADRLITLAEAAKSDLAAQVASVTTSLDGQLTKANESVAKLATTYTELPVTLGAKLEPVYLSLLPEITCRTLDGGGYGGCMRGRINGLLGEGVRIGGVFTQRFPELSLSINGIAGDVHKFTSKVVAPRGFWGTVKDVTVTGSGVARAASAAGIF